MPFSSFLPRRPRTLAAALAAALLLTGCGTEGPALPDGAPARDTSASATPSGTASPAGLPTQWPAPAEISAEGLGDMDLHTISDNTRHIHVVVPQVPGADGLNEHLRTEAQERVDAFSADVAPSPDDAAAPALNGRWGIIGASGRILGVVANVTEKREGASVTDGHTHWFDAEAGDVVGPLGLVEPAHEADLVRAVRDAVAALPGASADRAEKELRDGHVRTWFSPDGALLVGFDEHTVLPEAPGMPAVPVPAADVEPWLSPAGQAVREAVLRPDPAAWAAAHEAPASSPEPSGAPSAGAVPAPSSAPASPSARATPTAKPKPAATPTPTAKSKPSAKASKAPKAGDTDCSVKKCVALTFDDGPKPATDATLLKVLADHDVKATFFMLGTAVDAFPDTAREIAAAGHELGNHSTTHPLLDGLTASQVDAELEQASSSISSATGKHPKVMRPPYGATDATVKQAIADHDMRQTLWDVDTRDWEHKDPVQTLANVKAETGRNSIILMHDIHETSVAAVDDVITWLEGQGYTLVTVSDLQNG